MWKNFPANICWSSRCLQDMSWSRLQHVFSVTTFLSSKTYSRRLVKTSCENVLEDEKLLRWRRLKDVLKASWKHVLKTSWRHVLVLNTSWRYVLKTFSRHLGNKRIVYWEYMYLTNLIVYLTNLYLTSLYLTVLRRTQNALTRAK